MEITIRFHVSHTLRSTVNARPCTDCGHSSNEYCRDDEKEALNPSRCRAVLNESPYNVFAVHRVGEKGSGNNELVDQRLTTIFKISGFHCQDPSRQESADPFEPTILRGSSASRKFTPLRSARSGVSDTNADHPLLVKKGGPRLDRSRPKCVRIP